MMLNIFNQKILKEDMDLVLKSLIMLGIEKGYKPVAITDTNLFLITDEIFNESNFYELDLKESRDDQEIEINVFYGYNGDLIFTENEIQTSDGIF